MKKLIFALCLMGFILFGWSSVASASSQNTFELKVLPLNCVFETVADGSNEIIYLTPETCGQAVQPLHPDAQTDQRFPEIAQRPTLNEVIPENPDSPGAAIKPDTDERNIISQVSHVAKAGAAVMVSNPLYFSLVAIVLLPILVLSNLLPFGGMVRRVASLIKFLLP
jgi:hypothetical protein